MYIRQQLKCFSCLMSSTLSVLCNLPSKLKTGIFDCHKKDHFTSFYYDAVPVILTATRIFYLHDSFCRGTPLERQRKILFSLFEKNKTALYNLHCRRKNTFIFKFKEYVAEHSHLHTDVAAEINLVLDTTPNS